MSPDSGASGAGRLGPGPLVLIVGPSGAGKDTLINLAREALGDDPRFYFVRRVVTRPAGAHEDHDSLDEAGFAAQLGAGSFSLTWQAHGLSYGLPADAVEAIKAGRVVIANVSRTVIAEARLRFAHVLVILVTAPAEILAARLAGRGRDESIPERLQRASLVSLAGGCDVLIENTSAPSHGAGALIAALRAVAPQATDPAPLRTNDAQA